MKALALMLCSCSPSLPLSASDWTTATEAAALLGLPIEPGPAITVTWSPTAQTTDRSGSVTRA